MNKYVLLLLLLLSLKGFTQNKTDQSYDSLISNLFLEDQKVREELNALLEDKNIKQEKLHEHFIKLQEVDLNNQKIAFPILDNYLDQKIQLEDQSLNNLYYIIQHSDGSVQEKYSNFVTLLFKKNNISNQEYAWFIDRLNVRKNKSQKYGFQVKYWSETEEGFPYPIIASYEENCQSIGVNSSKEHMNNTYINEYSAQYITENEFVIFGHVRNATQDTSIVVNSQIPISINKKGFYALKLNKEDFVIDVFDKDINKHSKKVDISSRDWLELDFDLYEL